MMLVGDGRDLDVAELEAPGDAVEQHVGVETVERVYEGAGLEMTNDARAQIEAFMAAHPRGRDGQVVYDIRADFDAEPADVRAPFDFYMNEFDIRVEVK